MLILKIKDKGLYLEIPGMMPTRTPVEIDITKCNLSLITVYLRKQGIKNYQIVSESKKEVTHKPQEILKEIEDLSLDQSTLNKRFSRLEQMMVKLFEKDNGSNELKEEQINKKLDRLEKITSKLLDKKYDVVIEKKSVTESKRKEPQFEELDSQFIPSIDVSNLKMKSGSTKTIKQDKIDLDDNVNLLSGIMSQED